MGLILTRKTGEEIRIGADVVLRVVRIKGGQVRLAVEAPPGVKILRNELTQVADRAASETRAGPCRALVAVGAAF